ncbi:hypothetical protein A1O1_08334 [Capronia coronata CBS 617.96]|uniref:C2H2-type domain-containing protein n=1 Tax=Capronia coronata CBS 617.96 TaxID=1182541 RepID=W9XI43_9EURO|nr:uncharacterized protein A1O1_08334 [Capronia coronata CBS 617.96]EXJ80192.1 hypothetical protein A1O1_08334 [Capronia coronata CBS 617.96]
MPIPGARFDDAPPPLPPPRYNEDLAQGVDVAWSWANSDPFNSTPRRLAPIKPSSSLYGGYLYSRRNSARSRDDEMDMDSDYPRRGSDVSTVKSAGQTAVPKAGQIPTLTRKPPSPATSMANQRLQGETPLAQQNFNLSSQAYDQRVLSKIGKPNSPPRPPRFGSSETPMFPQKLALQTKNPKSQSTPTNDLPSATLDPISRWITSPVSAGVSPGSRPGWRDYNMDHRSSSMDSAAASLVLDPELFVQPRPSGFLSTSGSIQGNEDTTSVASRSQRSSYDQGVFPDGESDLAGDECGAFRLLNCGDSQQQTSRRSSQLGTKRRARSPPSDAAREDKSPLHGNLVSEQFPRMQTALYRLEHGSVSSTSSSVRQNSYASSAAISVARSSMTSISSFDRQSPMDPYQTTYLTSIHTVSSPATSTAPSRPHPLQSPLEAKSSFPAMSIQSAINDSRMPLPPATRIGNYFICDCCPKKPRKYDTEEELRAHQMEKQYSCQYCHNRFKNKNEAERHQNSLHLRRQSWACAAIPNFQAAFYPSASPSGIGLEAPSSDTCGFCGEEFPNIPRPDWDRRIDHLTNVHKFGECNQAKKFFRADHFRQHLKHSHAGQSGKWTNVLETVCLREEFPLESAGVSPTGSTSSPGRGPGMPSEPPMGGATINEAQDET